MPKRPVTPPIDDGAKYLTVVHPYPPRPNMEIEPHRKLFAQWVAACVGSQHLLSFYYKPTSPGSLILELDETMPEFKRILGAHEWSKFLRDPTDVIGKVSMVFYCTYKSDRVVQKNGWKRVDVKESWFSSQTKAASKFVTPYPPTVWCAVPKMIGNIIQNDLCRPLPKAEFPPPPPQPMPVVGTPEWQEWKQAQNQATAVPASPSGARPLQRSVGAITPTSPMTRASSAQGVSASVSTSVVDVSERTPGSMSPLGGPPGLERMSSSRSSTHSATAVSERLAPIGPPSNSNSSSTSTRSPISPVDNPGDYGKVIAGYDMEIALASLRVDDDEDVFFSVADARSVADTTSGPEAEDCLWEGYVSQDSESDYEDDDKTLARAARKDPTLCRIHNKVCPKGICRVYAQQRREARNRARDEERRREREAAYERHQARMRERRGKEPASNGGGRRLPPPHLRAGAPPPGPAPMLPPHLRRGAPPVASAPSKSASHITPIRSLRVADDARSTSSGSSASKSSESAQSASSPTSSSSSSQGGRGGRQPPACGPPRPWGVWGKAPSISAEEVRRNNDSWNVSDVKNAVDELDDNDQHSDDDDDDNESVAGRTVAQSMTSGWGSAREVDGPWGNSSIVRESTSKARAEARVAGTRGRGKGAPKHKSWADEMDELDGETRSTGDSTSWGNVSVGFW